MKNRILGTTALVVAAVSPFAAFAQTADQVSTQAPAQADVSQVDEIIVTGSYRRSLEEAVDIKRKTVGFSDSIVATDVANFPEQNLAEALQRIPGVTIERNRGLG
jgi:iron complex outermembrane recepter protein